MFALHKISILIALTPRHSYATLTQWLKQPPENKKKKENGAMEMDADNADFESQSKSESECEYGLVPAGKQEKIRNNAAHSAIGLGGKKSQKTQFEMGRQKGKVSLKTKLRRN